MKKLSLLMIICLLQGCENQNYLHKDEKTQELTTTLLEIRKGLAYLPKSPELFTGKFVYYCVKDTNSSESARSSINLMLENGNLSRSMEDSDIKGAGDEISSVKPVCIEESYLNGKRNGISTGKDSIESEFKTSYNYKDGILHGLRQLFCIKDGKEEECGLTNYKDGVESGITKRYRTNEGLYSVSINLGNTPESDIQAAIKNLVEDKDKIENRSWYSDVTSLAHKGTGIQAYIGKSHNSIRLRCKFNYEAKNWLFIKSIIIATDNGRFEKNDVAFERDNDLRGINEWYDILALDEDLKILKAIINSKETTIRFKGNTSYYDYVVTAKEKTALKNVVDAYEALLAISS